MPEQPPTAILVHGFLDSDEVWRPVMNILGTPAAGWITPDLPGMGELTKTEGPFTLRGYADLVTASIDRVGGAVVLVGHSMGAQIVELAAVRRSQSVLGLLLLSPVPLAGAHAPDPVAGALAATGGDVNAQREARRSLMAQPADAKVLEWLTGLGRNVRRDVTEQLVAAWNEGVAEGRGPSAFDRPVLVASGDADPFVTTQMSIDVAGRFRNCSRVALKDCGHWPQAEHPELVAKLVSDFIVSVSSKPGAGKGRRWLDTRLWRPQREQLRRGLRSFGGF